MLLRMLFAFRSTFKKGGIGLFESPGEWEKLHSWMSVAIEAL
jgi:hypothetical protein